jgi:energy-coupling factor transport system ATP-binding protein
MLSQNPSDIMIEQTVADELSRSPDGEKYAHEKVSAVLDELGFDRKLLGAHPFDLSGGELQRAAIAKLLLTDCKILLLDEPSKGLDVSSKKRLSRLFRRLAESGKAVIFVTHDLDFAAETADRAALVFGGKIAANQPAEKFFSQNTLYTTAAARISRNVFRGAVTSQKLIEACKNARKGAENEVL